MQITCLGPCSMSSCSFFPPPPRPPLNDAVFSVRGGALALLTLRLPATRPAGTAYQLREKTAKSNAVVLEMIGDLPDADMKPPENVLFVCKLNPVTTDDDLEIIFTR